MKKILFTTALVIALAVGAGNVHAQMAGQQMMGQNQQQSYQSGQKGQQQVQPGTMMGPWMMDNIMGGGMMMGPGMMGNMMSGGMMMGSPMMGFAVGMDNEKIAQYEKFMKETKEMRRKLYNMRFEYGEALWNPDTTLKDLREILKKMNQLQQEIQQKMPR